MIDQRMQDTNYPTIDDLKEDMVRIGEKLDRMRTDLIRLMFALSVAHILVVYLMLRFFFS
ncbi:MAG: hypothetical protein WA960_23100 [Tunicatimonas sp.]